MNNRKRVVVTFKGPEVEALARVAESMNEPSEQSAIRSLVKIEYGKRFTVPPYKQGSTNVPRETKAERMRRILSMSDADMTEYLRKPLDDEFRKAPDDLIQIETTVTGLKIVRVKSPSTGMNDEVGLEYYLKRWEAEKRLPTE